MRVFLFLVLAIMPFESNAVHEIVIDPNVATLKESVTLAAQRKVLRRRKAGLPVFNFGLGANPLGAPKSMVEAMKSHAHIKHYAPIEGVFGLAELISSKYAVGDFAPTANDVVVAPGLKILIRDVQHAFGGEIVHVIPAWVSYMEQAKSLGKEPKLIHTKRENDFKLVPSEIHALAEHEPNKPRLIIFNHPVNPTGAAYTEKELKELAKAFGQYNFVVFADEVYLGNHHQGMRHSIARFLPQRTVRATSLSKEFGSGGDRMGWTVFSPQLRSLRDAVAAVGTATYSCAPVPQQFAAKHALSESEEISDYLQASQAIFSELGDQMSRRLQEIGLDYVAPKAAWYLFAGFNHLADALKKKGIHTSADLANRLVEEVGIVTVAGSGFGMPEEQLYLRMSYVDFDGEAALEAAHLAKAGKLPENLVNSFAANLHRGMDALAAWVKELER